MYVYSVVVIFGHTRSNGIALSKEQIKEAEDTVTKKLDALFGGCTGDKKRNGSPGLDEEGEPIYEDSSYIEVFTDKDIAEYEDEIIDVAAEIGFDLEQESVIVKWECSVGRLHFVKPRKRKPSASLARETEELSVVLPAKV